MPNVCSRAFCQECKEFLCLFHVLKAWLENLRRRLTDKSRFREAFDTLSKIVYWKRPGASQEEKAATINFLISEFRRTFAAESGLLHYFASFWDQKKGKTLILCFQFDLRITPIVRVMSVMFDCEWAPS
jgi:hypothetical protein